MKNLLSLFRAFVIVTMIATALFSSEGNIDTLTAFELVGTGVVLFALSFAIPKMSGVAFDTIGLDAARGAFTNAVVAVYRERISPSSFLRSFFPSTFSPTRFISFEVRRGTEKIAVDILRGTGSNLNKKSRSTLKTLEPPLYAESHNVNELAVYDTAFGTLDPTLIAQLATEAAEELTIMQDKIERAYEKQAADVFNTGIIQLVNGDNIDFKRKAGSFNDLTGAYWTDDTIDPMIELDRGAAFIREEGKAQGGVYNVIMGTSAFNAMVNNPIFQAKYDIKNITLGEIHEPQRVSIGASVHGKVSSGAYTYIIWTYIEGYRNSAGTFVKYIPNTDFIMLPQVTDFKTTHALVPQLPGMTPTNSLSGGVYVMHEYVDVQKRNHTQEILSAGAVLPLAIDTIYTSKVTAS